MEVSKLEPCVTFWFRIWLTISNTKCPWASISWRLAFFFVTSDMILSNQLLDDFLDQNIHEGNIDVQGPSTG